jgi:hypothetical protein
MEIAVHAHRTTADRETGHRATAVEQLQAERVAVVVVVGGSWARAPMPCELTTR